MCGRGITKSKDYLLKPIGNNTFSIHQITNCFQNCFEIVFFGFTSDQNIERVVNVVLITEGLIHVLLILIAVEPNPIRSEVCVIEWFVECGLIDELSLWV